MIVLEVLALVICWAWIFTSVLFLRNTILPRMPLADISRAAPFQYEAIEFQATDEVRLAGWKVPTNAEAPWIILCHGMGTNRLDLMDIAVALHEAGFNLLMFDFRGHGESGGRTTSFGWREQRDLEGALAFLGSQPEIPAQPYGVFGLSMGGAVAIMVAARDERLAAVAVDSIYSDLEDSIATHLKLLYRMPRIPFLTFIKPTYRLRFGVWPSQMSPRRVIGRISPRGLLVIHGEQDPRMPIAEATALVEAAGDPKELWIVPGAVHLGGLQTDRGTYHQKLIRFFASHLKPTSTRKPIQ